MRIPTLFSLLVVLFLVGCSTSSPTDEAKPIEETASEEDETTAESTTEPTTEPSTVATSQTSGDSVTPTEDAVNARVAAAKQRLETTEAGQLVWQAIEAHGGLEKWYANGPIAFRFDYSPVDGSSRDSYQVVDQWSSRAVHELADDRDVKFGWDGEKAWHTPVEGDFPMRAPRFWALTPYYFIGVPWVFGDPGVQFELLKPRPFEGSTYDRVKVTFTEGTGDAPDDYYIVFINQKTKRVGGVTYIVSYPGFFPDGGHSDPKFMAYDGAQTVGGLTFPETFRTFKLVDGKPTEIVTNTTMTDVAFRPELESSYFEIPDEATVVEGY